jgi:hypothetical protein
MPGGMPPPGPMIMVCKPQSKEVPLPSLADCNFLLVKYYHPWYTMHALLLLMLLPASGRVSDLLQHIHTLYTH